MTIDQSPNPAVAPDSTSAAAQDIPRRTTSVYMPVTVLDELDRVAAEMERSRTWVIEKAVQEWLERRKQKRAP